MPCPNTDLPTRTSRSSQTSRDTNLQQLIHQMNQLGGSPGLMSGPYWRRSPAGDQRHAWRGWLTLCLRDWRVWCAATRARSVGSSRSSRRMAAYASRRDVALIEGPRRRRAQQMRTLLSLCPRHRDFIVRSAATGPGVTGIMSTGLIRSGSGRVCGGHGHIFVCPATASLTCEVVAVSRAVGSLRRCSRVRLRSTELPCRGCTLR
jgi:hypothetical protein